MGHDGRVEGEPRQRPQRGLVRRAPGHRRGGVEPEHVLILFVVCPPPADEGFPAPPNGGRIQQAREDWVRFLHEPGALVEQR